MEFGQIKELVTKQADNHWDELYLPGVMEFQDFNAISIDNQLYSVAGSAKRLIGQRLGIPAPYIERCPPDLQAENLNYWLRRIDQNKNLFCRFDGQDLRAIFTSRYQPMDHHTILLQLDVPEDTKCEFRIDENMMQLSIPDPSNRFMVSAGDELVPGVALSNSEVGLKSFNISAYYLRIVCTNGLISTDVVSQSFRHTSTKGLDNFYGTMQSVSQSVLANSDRFKIAINQEAENPQALIANFGKHFRLTQKDIDHVQAFYESPNTMWAVINAFTAAANAPSLSVGKSAQLQTIGGKILSLVK